MQPNIRIYFFVFLTACLQSCTDSRVIHNTPLPCWPKAFCDRLPFIHYRSSSITMSSEPAANKQDTHYNYWRSSASSSISDANEVVYFCYACKEEIPPRHLQIIDFDAGPNPMFIKPFHFTCVPNYYRNKDDIEEERQEERKREEKEMGYRPPNPNMGWWWGRVSPRKINQPKLVR